jgi:zinc transport system substrate-binding protein
VVAACFSALFHSCTRKSGQEEGQLLIATSLFPVQSIVANLSGSQAESFFAVPVNANPHAYEPSPSLVRRLKKAKLFISIHPELDGWMKKYLAPEAAVLDLSGLVDLSGFGDNPHFWVSPHRLKPCTDTIAKALCRLLPSRSQDFEMNRMLFLARLDSLEQRIHAVSRICSGAKFIQWHPAWDYFASDYGFDLFGTIEKGHGKEPSVKDIESLIRQARGQDVRAVIVGMAMENKAAFNIALEIRAQLIRLDHIGDPGDPLRSGYIRMMDFNMDRLARSCGGREVRP